MLRVLRSVVFAMLCVLAGQAFAQTPVPDPIGGGGGGVPGVSDCEDLQRLITNTEFAVANQNVIVSNCLSDYELACVVSDTAREAWNRAIALGIPWMITDTYNEYLAAMTKANAAFAKYLAACFQRTCLQSLLQQYRAEFIANGCDMV